MVCMKYVLPAVIIYTALRLPYTLARWLDRLETLFFED